MPKRNQEPTSGSDKAKVRVFFAQVEGNNESVQEALRTMVQAMSPPLRVLAENHTNGRATALLEQSDQDEDLEVISGPADPGEPVPSPEARKSRGSGKKIDRNAGLSLVADLEFRPNGEQSLVEFWSEKKPKNDVEAVLIVVYYMQHKMKVAKIGPSHVMTALKSVNKPIPVDLKQTLRNVQKSRIWLKFVDIEDIRTTTQGDNHVEHGLGKSEK